MSAPLLGLAMALARVAHDGQVRKGSGEPYVNHLSRVAARVQGWRAKTIAYLHDTVEDTYVSMYTLASAGFPLDICDDVIALSRGGSESYFEFIERTIRDGSDDALQVKLADLADNLNDPSWTPPRARYIKADAMVRAALIERGATPLTEPS